MHLTEIHYIMKYGMEIDFSMHLGSHEKLQEYEKKEYHPRAQTACRDYVGTTGTVDQEVCPWGWYCLI